MPTKIKHGDLLCVSGKLSRRGGVEPPSYQRCYTIEGFYAERQAGLAERFREIDDYENHPSREWDRSFDAYREHNRALGGQDRNLCSQGGIIADDGLTARQRYTSRGEIVIDVRLGDVVELQGKGYIIGFEPNGNGTLTPAGVSQNSEAHP